MSFKLFPAVSIFSPNVNKNSKAKKPADTVGYSHFTELNKSDAPKNEVTRLGIEIIKYTQAIEILRVSVG